MNADKGFGVFEVNHTMIYFQYWSAEANRVIDEAIICAVPGCGPPPHATLDELQQPMQPAATRPDMILPPVEALTPPEATETAEARLPDDVGPLDPQYYADYADDGDLHEYPAADEAKGSGGLHQPEPEVTVPAPKVSMEPKPPATFSPKPPATFVTKQPTASPTAAGLVTPEEQGTQPGPVREGSSPSGADGPNLQGSAGTAKQPPEVENLPGLRPQPGKAAWTPKAPAVSNKTGTRPVADSKAGQGSGDKPDHVQGPDSNGFVPIWHVSGEDFVTPYEHSAAAAAAAAAQQAERPAEAAVGPPESASPVGTREAEASLPNVAEVRSTERRVPVGLILAVVALCFATLLGIIASVGLLLLRSRAQAYNASRSDRNALPTTTTHTNAMPMQTDPSLLPSEPGTPASYRPWTQVKRLSSAGASKIRASLEGPVLSLREIHVNALAPTLQASGNGEAEVRPASSSTYLVFGIPTPRWNRSRPSTPGRGQTQPNPLHDPNTSAQQASCDVTQMPTPEMA